MLLFIFAVLLFTISISVIIGFNYFCDAMSDRYDEKLEQQRFKM
jgi:hypothetical protein